MVQFGTRKFLNCVLFYYIHIHITAVCIFLLQAMCDTLPDQIFSNSSSSGRLSATAVRGVYSLLGEGGLQFPSLVLDVDSGQT